MVRNCKVCEIQFDDRSPEKRRAGGLITHCPECSEETEVRVLGIACSAGKMSGVEILRFESKSDRAAYQEFYAANSGLHKGKSCQLSRGLKTTPKIKFKTLHSNHPNANHKGKR